MEDATAEGLVRRMVEATGAKNESHLAQIVGVTPQSLSNAKRKDAIPPAWVMGVAEKKAVSLDWLYFGAGNMYRTGAAESSPGSSVAIDRQVLLEVVETLESILNSAKKKLPPKAKAELVYQLYMLVLEEEADNRKPLRIFKLVQDALVINE